MQRRTHHHVFLIRSYILIMGIGFFITCTSNSMAVISEGKSAKEMRQGENELGQLIVVGEVTRVQGEFVGKDFSQMKDQRYRIETPYGEEWILHFGDHTQKIGEINLGDRIQARVSKDGLLYKVQKISQNNTGTTAQQPVVRRRIVGTIERMEGKFVFLRQGDRTEILHVDDRSQIQGNIHEGSKIAANLGEAGYAIGIEEIDSEPSTNSTSTK